MSKLKRFLKIKFAKNKDLAFFQLVNEIAEVVSEELTKLDNRFNELSEKTIEELKERVVKRTIELRGDKGEAGERGERGASGKDGQEGVSGRDGVNGKDGVGINGIDGQDGKDGKDGKDGSPDTGNEIVGKINKASELIDASRINFPIEGKRLGAQGGSGAGAERVGVTPSGSINGSNTIFTLPTIPRAGSVKVFVNGMRFKVGEDYNISGVTITMVTAPPSTSIILIDYESS